MSSDLEKGIDRQLSRADLGNNTTSNPDFDNARISRQASPQETSFAFAEEEPNWPTNWRAYTALLGCFFLMFNSWGIINAYGSKYLWPSLDLNMRQAQHCV